jgi:hypothetical protein
VTGFVHPPVGQLRLLQHPRPVLSQPRASTVSG